MSRIPISVESLGADMLRRLADGRSAPLQFIDVPNSYDATLADMRQLTRLALAHIGKPWLIRVSMYRGNGDEPVFRLERLGEWRPGEPRRQGGNLVLGPAKFDWESFLPGEWEDFSGITRQLIHQSINDWKQKNGQGDRRFSVTKSPAGDGWRVSREE